MWPFKKKQAQPDNLEALIQSIPQRWMVWSIGQDPAFGLWGCKLYRINTEASDDNVLFSCEECDTPNEALKCCLSQLKDGKRTCRYGTCKYQGDPDVQD